jgi:hypothetical protein
MNSIARQSLWALTKLGIAGASLVAIGWSVITFYPTKGGVKETEADIVSMVTFKRTSTQQFALALDALGHDRPRSYDYNGNKVFFSSRTTTQSPEQVLREYQEFFTRRGINERPYYEASPDGGPRPGENDETYQALVEERGLAMLSGQLVPSIITPNYVAMGGGIIEGEPRTCAEAAEILERQVANGIPHFNDVFRGFRGIEAMRSEDGRHTHVTASWSESNYDMDKHIPRDTRAKVRGTNPDPELPSCPGCERLQRFAGEGKEKDYVTNVFLSPQHHSSVASFYLQAMQARGWKETDSSQFSRDILNMTVYRDLPATSLQLVRGNEFLNIVVEPTDQGTLVTTMTAP